MVEAAVSRARAASVRTGDSPDMETPPRRPGRCRCVTIGSGGETWVRCGPARRSCSRSSACRSSCRSRRACRSVAPRTGCPCRSSRRRRWTAGQEPGTAASKACGSSSSHSARRAAIFSCICLAASWRRALMLGEFASAQPTRPIVMAPAITNGRRDGRFTRPASWAADFAFLAMYLPASLRSFRASRSSLPISMFGISILERSMRGTSTSRRYSLRSLRTSPSSLRVSPRALAMSSRDISGSFSSGSRSLR